MEAASATERHVLVAGGAGYVGNVLVRNLLARGYRVRVLDRLLFDQGSSLSSLFEERRFSFMRGDICEREDVGRALSGATDAVLLAALVGDPISRSYPELTKRVNGDGARLVFEMCADAGIDRFVFTSTCSNYGLRDTEEPATEESELEPLSLYAQTKVEFEQHVLSLRNSWRVCPTLLRIATAYGLSPRMRFDLTISEFTRTLALGEELLVYDADTWRPYCHVLDISRAIIRALEAPQDLVRGEVFNVGHSDENYTKRMVVDAVQDHVGGAGRVSFTEGGFDARNYRVSFEKIGKRLGFEARERMPKAVGCLVDAIRAGAFDDVESRPTFHGNHSIVGLHEAADGGD